MSVSIKQAHSHCMARVKGGMFGSHRCNERVALEERYCGKCKKRIEQEAAAREPRGNEGNVCDGGSRDSSSTGLVCANSRTSSAISNAKVARREGQ